MVFESLTLTPPHLYTLPKIKKRMESWRLELLTSLSDLQDFTSLNALFLINWGQVKEWSIHSCRNKKTTRKKIKFTLESIDETTKYGDQHPCNRLAVQCNEMSCNHKYKGTHYSNLIGQHWSRRSDSEVSNSRCMIPSFLLRNIRESLWAFANISYIPLA